MSCANTKEESEVHKKNLEQSEYPENFQTENASEIDHDKSATYKKCQAIAQSLVNDISIQSERNYQSEESENSEDSFTNPSRKLRTLTEKRQKKQKGRKKSVKKLPCRFSMTIRRGRKFSSVASSKRDLQKVCGRKNYLKPSVKIQNFEEKRKEIPLTGKRGLVGGKAKGKTTLEEIYDKQDSDDESESFYCYRVSLGHFQQFKDDSGASTSYQCDEDDYHKASSLINYEKAHTDNSDEVELMELQKWGMASFVTANNMHEKIEKLSIKEENKPEL